MWTVWGFCCAIRATSHSTPRLISSANCSSVGDNRCTQTGWFDRLVPAAPSREPRDHCFLHHRVSVRCAMMTELPRHARRRVATAIVCVIVGNLHLRHARTRGSVPRTHPRGSGTDVEVPAASGKIKERFDKDSFLFGIYYLVVRRRFRWYPKKLRKGLIRIVSWFEHI